MILVSDMRSRTSYSGHLPGEWAANSHCPGAGAATGRVFFPGEQAISTPKFRFRAVSICFLK